MLFCWKHLTADLLWHASHWNGLRSAWRMQRRLQYTRWLENTGKDWSTLPGTFRRDAERRWQAYKEWRKS